VLARRLQKTDTRKALLETARARYAENRLAIERRGLVPMTTGVSEAPLLLVRHAGTRPFPLDVSSEFRPPVIAVVGARAVDPYGRMLAHQIGATLAEMGVVVASGGAEGCDRAAHEGALDAGGRTLAFVPGGLDAPYPAIHAELFSRVVHEGGALVGIDWPDQSPRRPSFIERNLAMAALCDAVIVVRAANGSGSMTTAAFARRLGRPLGAVPGNVGAALSDGCLTLLEEGATVLSSPTAIQRFVSALRSAPLLVPTPSAEMGRWPTRTVPSAAPWPEPPSIRPGRFAGASSIAHQSIPATEDEAALIRVIRGEPGIDLDSLATRTNVAPPVLAGMLLHLEVTGRVARIAGGRYMASD
jgi:DNA processing protein